MSEQSPEPDGAPGVGEGTDISAADLDVSDGSRGETPATSDPAEYVDDGALGGTGGPSPGGAG